MTSEANALNLTSKIFPLPFGPIFIPDVARPLPLLPSVRPFDRHTDNELEFAGWAESRAAAARKYACVRLDVLRFGLKRFAQIFFIDKHLARNYDLVDIH